ncbi:MAG: aromatic-ring-hydroxylating dioxygenase subunit beta [Hyphomonadaceae bacterium JAD_PAG50586_4]|nr:MAG: aromatic-ring-hydroxylating dioxygenase subunit beta [Hyphomonadaceae bacterium JAD_PAG50586_4]
MPARDTVLAPPSASTYVNDALYARVMEELRWAAEAPPANAAATLRRTIEGFLHYEARLLDQGQFEAWANLFAPECIYWAPANPAADVRNNVAIFFDDRRRLDDRVTRLLSSYAHNQAPRPRLRHLISNIEIWPIENGARVLSSQIVHQHRSGRHSVVYVSGVGHTLRKTDEGWRIELKRITLVNFDEALEPPTLL